MSNKLLILTQTMDKGDRELGFFHKWVSEFAKHSDPLTVVCLKKGVCDLPKHVKILSLGKEEGRSRFKYVLRFYKYIWQERKNYDAVFVHMNEEYIILGGLLWKLWGKRITMWRNHLQGTAYTRWAVYLSNKVFCTSPKSYTARFDKTKVMPAGVDMDLYTGVSSVTKDKSILFFGRLSPVKNIHVFIEALSALDKNGTNFHADIVGSPANPEDIDYEKTLHGLGKSLVEAGKLSFLPGVPHEQTVSVYGRYALYVNLTPDGSFDKTMLEAMASRVPILISNTVFRGNISDKCQLTSLEAGSTSDKMKVLLSMGDEERKVLGESLRTFASNTHGLAYLVESLERDIFSGSKD